MMNQDEYDFECETWADDGGGPPPGGVFDATFDATFN
jgi:hypothetical protein